MIINLACMVINSIQHKLEALLTQSLWAPVYVTGFGKTRHL